MSNPEDLPTFRTPPHNYEAEQALLGAILLNNRTFERVSEYLRPEHFADPTHGRVFAACAKLIERGQIANPVTLTTYFQHDGGLEELGGTPYLAQLANAVVSIIDAEDYAKLIHDLHLRRELIELGETMVNQAHAPKIDEPAMDQIGRAEAQLYELATTGQTEGGFETFGQVLVEAVKQAESAHKRQGKLSGVPTGLIDLDKKLGGLHPSDLLILAGRPSMGKTSLATNIAYNAAKAYREEVDALGNKKAADGGVVAFFSLEMSSEQLATRILAEAAEIQSHKIRQGEMSNDEFEKLVVAAQELHRLPLHIDDTPALSISSVRTRARRLKRQQGLHLIVVDYLQLLRGSGATAESRVQEVSEITRGLKALAKELDLPVIALSQLSRAVEQREDKRPQLSDLRESGSIEQDADVVMFVFREQYYLERAEPGQRPDETPEKYNERHAKWQERCEEVWNTAEVIIAKQRHGPVGTVRLAFHGEFTKFGNLMTDDHYEEPGF
ncbi:replicative DNA helicase [Magnetospirillum sulfuroxidans]|uniref:Replicative DNA helicase n=1 Tax=Magnetospirillum sulfuroxidans TaxID=611300 RepID=A0ABS5I7C1_9PROT|nr:replicative DNA helicase [Magnetospirillum sulfuroxidans]MBR9970219.1 replicative DNA helicase [Magnetospirillum sulfuroxidans]